MKTQSSSILLYSVTTLSFPQLFLVNIDFCPFLFENICGRDKDELHFHLFFLPVQQCNTLVTKREPVLSLSILFWTRLNNHLVVLTKMHKPYDFLVLGSCHYSYQCFGGVDSIKITLLIYWKHKCIYENICTYIHTYAHIFIIKFYRVLLWLFSMSS